MGIQSEALVTQKLAPELARKKSTIQLYFQNDRSIRKDEKQNIITAL